MLPRFVWKSHTIDIVILVILLVSIQDVQSEFYLMIHIIAIVAIGTLLILSLFQSISSLAHSKLTNDSDL